MFEYFRNVVYVLIVKVKHLKYNRNEDRFEIL